MNTNKIKYENLNSKRLWYAVFRIIVVLFILYGCSLASEPKKVLYISSYHPGFPTFFQQVDGIKTIFKKNDVLLDIEFMDTKRFPKKLNWDLFQKSLTYKLEQTDSYDAIMVADDNALIFAIEQQTKLFNEKPIIFLGVNNIDRALEQNKNFKITGVVESVSMEETIELMIDLRPKATNIIALVDNTPSGQSDLELFYQVAKKFSFYKFSDISLAKMPWPEFISALGDIKEDSSVLLLSAYQDINKKTLLFDESLKKIKKTLSVPIFHLWYHGLGDGILGGKIISHKEQGKVAANIVLQILNGKPVEQIKVINLSPNRFVFDYLELKKYDLYKSLLPKNSLILNKPYSFYQNNKLLIWGIATVIGTLSVSLIFTIVNIYRRKQIEKILRSSEAHLRTVIETIPDLIWLKDPDGLYLSCNKKFERFFGAKETEIVGKTDYNFVNKEMADFFREKDKAAMAAEKTRVNEEEVTYADDGHREILETVKTPMYGDDGQLIGVLGIARDITERKRLEEERKKLENNLRQSHKMEAIGTLSGGIAHDFNNILGIILGNTELAMDDIDKRNPSYLYLEEITKAGLRASDIVKQLLNFSRKTDQAKKAIDIRLLIKDSIKMLRASIPTSIDIQVNLLEDLSTIYADSTQINQVLVNLCTNAAHAMEDSGGVLKIELSQIELDNTTVTQFQKIEAGQYIQLSISDTGHGIDPEIKVNIFDPYFTTKPIGKGTGMGLAIVLGIVKNHNGAISVYSEKNKGTSFKVLFPVIEGEEFMENGLLQSLPTGNETILFVDDEKALVKIGKNILESLGYRVETKTDPSEALDLFRSDPSRFNLIITDMTMPLINGEKLTKEALKINPDIPVILCTGFSSQIDSEKAITIGAHSYMEKPIDKKRLAYAVRCALDD